MMEHKFQVGDTVRIRDRGRLSGKTQLAAPLDDIEGGWRIDPPRAGFKYWNEADMVLVKPKDTSAP